MLTYIFIAFLFILVLTLLFWQFSNLMSMAIGAPAITSPQPDLWRQLADKDKNFIDLGSGSGTVCLKAAPYFKQVYGIEYSPFYYWLSRFRTREVSNITILYGNFFRLTWPKVDFIYCYLLPDVLAKLRPKFKTQDQAKVLSLTFPIPDWKAKKVIKDRQYKLFVY